MVGGRGRMATTIVPIHRCVIVIPGRWCGCVASRRPLCIGISRVCLRWVLVPAAKQTAASEPRHCDYSNRLGYSRDMQRLEDAIRSWI